MKKIMILAMTSALLSLGSFTTQSPTDEKNAATADNGNAAIENIMTRTSIRQYKTSPLSRRKSTSCSRLPWQPPRQ